MPAEIRKIDFSEIELREALALFHARTEGGPLKQGRVSRIKVMGGEEFSVVARVPSKDHGLIQKVFDHATTVAVMVLFAKHVGIPLPREGLKKMKPAQFGGVSLMVHYANQVC